MKIPKKYYKGDNHPIARTVGELKAALSELPNELRVEAGFGEAMQLVVYNHGSDDEHLEIIEHSDFED